MDKVEHAYLSLAILACDDIRKNRGRVNNPATAYGIVDGIRALLCQVGVAWQQDYDETLLVSLGYANAEDYKVEEDA